MNKTELLAPAGNLACALAAYESGADAVYAGMGRFNAREMGENFDWDDMSRLSAFAKKRGKRFYITLNTLIKEGELEQVAESAARLSELEPDAFIVQDAGVARMVRICFPDQEIHGSTQMGIHNSLGMETAAAMGISRVILERQVTLEELEAIIKRSPLEIEVFIHGALCCSLSGSCLLSSWMGGWSGNRGRCKQPCRRRYHGSGNKGKTSGFFFSTQDLYSLDLVQRYRDMGVASLKIEGRLKKPDYVKKTVTAYRMMLDASPSEKGDTLKRAKAVLAGSYGRKWSHGFATEKDMKEVISYKSMGVSGLLVGEVLRVDGNQIKARFSRTVRLGDRLRIQNRSGDEGPAFTVTRMFKNGRSIRQSEKNRDINLPWERDDPPSNGLIFRVGESTTFNRGEKLPLYQPPLKVDLNLELTARKLTVTSPQWRDDSVYEAPLDLDGADNKPLTEEELAQAFRATRSDKWQVGRIACRLEENLFFPAGQLKRVRREFWEWALMQLESKYRQPDGSAWRRVFSENRPKPWNHKKVKTGPDRIYGPTGKHREEFVEVKDIFHSFSKRDELILPDFCSENELDRLKKRVEGALKKGVTRFRITSLYQLSLFGGTKDLELTGSFPLPTVNSWAAEELRRLGLTRAQGWIELEEASLKQFVRDSPLPVEIYRSGRPALLSTRAEIPVTGEINDSRGKTLLVEKEGGLYRVYADDLLSLPGQKGCSSYFDNSHTSAKDKEKEKSCFNWERDLT